MLCVGVFVVFDSSYARAAMGSATGNDAFFYLKRQLIWAVLAIVALLIGMRVRYWRLRPGGCRSPPSAPSSSRSF